ncbi:MAG: tRNA(Met) cytidine acetyltransferase TmcA [Nanopusillaceae archaeon]
MNNIENVYSALLCKIFNHNHRGIVVISGDNYFEILNKMIKKYNEFLKNLNIYKDIKILYVTEDFYGEYLYRFENLADLLKDFEIIKVKYKDSKKVLGKTFDIIILDMYKSLTPNHLGIIIETLSGSGIAFLLVKDFDNFENNTTTFHEHLLTPPYKIEDVRKYFEYRFKQKLLQYDNIIIFDTSKGLIKGLDYKCEEIKIPERKKIIINENSKFSPRIYKLCLTQDQVNVLNMLENLLNNEKSIFLIIADRGRGKSASLGLSIAALSEILLEKKKMFDIGITAPSIENVEALFEFLKLGLKKNGIEFREISRTKISIKDKIYIEYREPINILKKKYDFLFVDEAAGIGINFLYKFTEKYNKIVFSSTIHGYEGAGRSFSVKFIKYLNSLKDVKIYRYFMNEPIRYNDGDPIEKWLYDSLLLDSEPEEINEKDIELIKKKEVNFYKVPLKEWFYNDNPKLKNFVGIYILAHYQNKPNDIAMLADAPHHDAFVLELKNGKIVNGIQVAYEGNIDDETIERMLRDFKPKGNIIPDIIVKHYRLKEFAKLRGLRIVRIATIPEIQGLGLGSIALEKLYEWGKENKYDWLGSSFGITYELLNFWQKNNFVLIHLSPEKNKVSGEYSGIVLKPLNEKSEKIIKKLNYEFRWRFINQISDVYFDLEPKIILKILETPYEFRPHFKLILTENQLERLKGYLESPMTYEAAADVAKLSYIYYLLYTYKDKPKIDEKYEEILVAKFLLSWSFKKIMDYFDLKKYESRRIIKKSIKTIYKWLENFI